MTDQTEGRRSIGDRAAPDGAHTSHAFRPTLLPTFGPLSTAFDPVSIRRDFPILDETIDGHPLTWLDNAATTQKPRVMIDRLGRFYRQENANVHRSAHALAARAADAYEAARATVARFMGASGPDEIVFVRGATEAINLVAQTWGRQEITPGDEIVISWLEHHSNIVPWQMLCAERGATLRVAPIDDAGDIVVDAFEALLGPRTRLVALTHVSNALGTVTPVRALATLARRHGARVLVDGAQAVSHMPIDVNALGVDFYAFSGHKVFGPSGIGALYARREVLRRMPPWQAGGNMIADVTFERTTYQPAPARFEAGTGSIADAVGLAAALDYLSRIGLAAVHDHEQALLAYAAARLSEIPGLRIVGRPRDRAGVISFVVDGIDASHLGRVLDRHGVAVRAGHHCAQPALRRLGVEQTVRASLALYNTRTDVDALVNVVRRECAGAT